jgi:hypothetical protein
MELVGCGPVAKLPTFFLTLPAHTPQHGGTKKGARKLPTGPTKGEGDETPGATGASPRTHQRSMASRVCVCVWGRRAIPPRGGGRLCHFRERGAAVAAAISSADLAPPSPLGQ